MRISTSLWLPALASLAEAASQQLGHIYITDASAPSHQSTSDSKHTVTPDTARLILASRLGLDQYLDLGDADDSTIQAINKFGGSQQLFASHEPQKSFALIFGDGIAEEDLPTSFTGFDVNIDISPVADANKALFADLFRQSGSRDAVEWWTVTDPEEFAAKYTQKQAQFDTVIALAMPKTDSKSGGFGSAVLSKRRQGPKEAPLSDSTLSSKPDSKATLTPNTPSIFANSSKPLKGILPHCFPSLASCQNITRNCNGHGSCGLKYTDKDAGKSSGKCYSCSCTADVRTNPDGTIKTTRWGGPACQKKDVVMPFWLLAGFSIVLVSIVSWGIGLLYTMGSEELPSVIGAGVSGPPRR